MIRKILPMCALLAALPTAANATGYIEGRLAANSTELESEGDKVEIDTTGFEFRGGADFNERVGVRFSYVDLDGDEVSFEGDDFDADTTFKFLRVGPTFNFTDVGTNARFYGAAEFARFTAGVEDEKDSDSGFDLAVGFADKGASKFLWEAELGFLKVKDTKGAFVQGTLGYRLNPAFALVAGLQSYAVEGEGDSEATFVNGTAGVRFSF